MASRNGSQNDRARSDERRYAARRAAAESEYDYRGHGHTGAPTSGREDDMTRGGGFSYVSPSGGEYMRGAPREYASEAYPDQGFGKVSHPRSAWRMEEKVFGPDSMIHDPLPGQHYRGVGPRGYRRADSRIQDDVCEALSDDDRLDASTIEVKVTDGEITLSGTVSSREDKRRAEFLADSVRGVRDVHNQLRIQQGQ